MSRNKWTGQIQLLEAALRVWWYAAIGDQRRAQMAASDGIDARMLIRRGVSEERAADQLRSLAGRHPELRMPAPPMH